MNELNEPFGHIEGARPAFHQVSVKPCIADREAAKRGFRDLPPGGFRFDQFYEVM